jgi:hypothetical protein
MAGTCGPTNTLYGNEVREAVQRHYGEGVTGDVVKVPAMRGGCGCMMQQGTRKLRGGGGCSGGTPMLKALGIMAGGRRKRGRSSRKRSSRKRSSRKCLGGYRPTLRNKAALRKYKAGKSIGFTMRSSLKAKGLIPRSNGTYKVSPKYR